MDAKALRVQERPEKQMLPTASPSLRTRARLRSFTLINAVALPCPHTHSTSHSFLLMKLSIYRAQPGSHWCLVAWGQPFSIITSRINLFSSLQKQMTSPTITLQSRGICFFLRTRTSDAFLLVPGSPGRQAGKGSLLALARGDIKGHRGHAASSG